MYEFKQHKEYGYSGYLDCNNKVIVTKFITLIYDPDVYIDCEPPELFEEHNHLYSNTSNRYTLSRFLLKISDFIMPNQIFGSKTILIVRCLDNYIGLVSEKAINNSFYSHSYTEGGFIYYIFHRTPYILNVLRRLYEQRLDKKMKKSQDALYKRLLESF